jgi:hypothetical protein
MLAVLLATTALPAYAANIEVHSIQGGRIITIDGEIDPNDFDVFKVKASPIGGKPAVFLGGPGGNVLAALQIGEFIRMKGWTTTVLNECDSACALIWLAGVQRTMTPTAKVGFHAASMDGQEKGMGNAMVGAYLNRIGLGKAVLFANAAGPDEITYLTPSMAKQVGIEVSVIDLQPVPAARIQYTVPPSALAKSQAADTASLGAVNYLTSHPCLTNGTVEEQVASLIAYLFSSWNNGHIQGFSALYSDSVLYYGKATSKANIMLDKQRFIERWVYRSYKIRPNSTSIRCNGSETQLDECAVWGIVDYEAVSKQSKQSTGSANFSYILKPYPTGTVWNRGSNQKPDVRITSEDSTVTERKISDYECKRHCYDGWQSPAEQNQTAK